MGLFSLFTKEIAIDLGTANTVILHENKVVVDEPSIIAMNFRTKAVVAVGKKALMMEGKTSGDIITVRPLKNGVIADFQAAESMLREFIKMTNMGRNLFSPAMKMVICIPSGITEVEERAVRESAEQAGAKEVRLIYEPMAAAIGSGIDVLETVCPSCRRPPEHRHKRVHEARAQPRYRTANGRTNQNQCGRGYTEP